MRKDIFEGQMYKKHLIWILCFLLVACKEKMPKLPSDILQPDSMVQILADMSIADAVAETKAQAGMSEEQLTKGYYEMICKTRGITAEQFNKSMKYYDEQPHWINKIYDEVQQELSKREATISQGK